jgi:hypothetical protein
MTEKTRIFICHKKKNADGQEDNSADRLYSFLSEGNPKYDVWMDEGLKAGIPWEKTIYENLISTHVLILVLVPGTSQSEWVKRELSIAMAFGIQIVPVGLNMSEEQLSKELANLGLMSIHYRRPFNISSQTARAIVPDLAPAIDLARETTEDGGYELLKKIAKRVQPKTLPADPPKLEMSSREFVLGTKKFSVHIAAGDIFRLSKYDILVNSENDYMQMARIFDSTTISSSIRHYGSSEEKPGFLEDTIQAEIEKVMAMAERPRPVPAGTAIVTSSGGPKSKLYRMNGITHIVHVASVHALPDAPPDQPRIVPLSSDGAIRDCVMAAMEAVQNICKANGDIWKANGVKSPEGNPPGDFEQKDNGTFAPKRMVLPLFGTGRGGQSPKKVGPVVLDAILDYFVSPLYEEKYFPLSDIHLSVFSKEDVDVIVDALSTADARR